MKKEHALFFGTLFGAKGHSAEEEKSIPVVITSYSQPHVLRQRMQEEKLSHGQTVTANISPVRLETNHGKMVMYFCPMESIEVLRQTADGDGGSLPAQAIVEGLQVPGNYKGGLYKLKNVQITSNGTMQVLATADTEWETI